MDVKVHLSETIESVSLKSIPHIGIVKISTLGDGSCFFHSVLRGFNRTYISASTWAERQKLVMSVRYMAADMLDEKTDTGKTYYELLSRGTLTEFSKQYPGASLRYMQKELKSSAPVDNIYQELISNALGLDIYFIDITRQDVYITSSDYDLLYKQRPSIVIAILQSSYIKIGHYDILGIRDKNGDVHTLLHPSDPFIVKLNQRMMRLLKTL